MSEKKCRLPFFLCFKMRDDGPTYDVLDVWKMGLTGKGIVVAVVDEGLEKNHQELKQNYVSVKTSFSTVHLGSCFNNTIIIIIGKLQEQVRLNKSCTVIDWPSGQDGAILSALYCLLCSHKNILLKSKRVGNLEKLFFLHENTWFIYKMCTPSFNQILILKAYFLITNGAPYK